MATKQNNRHGQQEVNRRYYRLPANRQHLLPAPTSVYSNRTLESIREATPLAENASLGGIMANWG